MHTLLAGTLLLVSFSVWAWSTPLGSAPDEPAHVVKAVALWQGDLRGTARSVESWRPGVDVDIDEFRVPRSYSSYAEVSRCSWTRPSVPAECPGRVPAGGGDSPALTAAGSYPPLYYALVGLPSRFLDGGTGVMAMRLLSALWCAVLGALALRSLSRTVPRPMVLAAVMVALPPMAYYLGGTVNPNGLEVVAALLVWCALPGLLVSWDPAARAPVGAAGELVVGAAVLANLRGLGLVFLAVIGLVGIVAAGPVRTLRLGRDRRVLLLAGVVMVVLVPAVVWAVTNPTVVVPNPPIAAGSSVLLTVVAQVDDWLRQEVAIFGWNDTGPVTLAVVPWTLAAVMLAGVVVAVARWRDQLVLWIAVLACLTVPVALQVAAAGEVGLIWMGRYLLPLTTGLPVLAVWLVRDRWPELRAGSTATTTAVLCGVGLVAAQYVWLHRNTVGVDGPVPLWSWDGWSPPLPPVVLLALTPVVPVAVAVAAAWGRRASVADLPLEAVEAVADTPEAGPPAADRPLDEVEEPQPSRRPQS